MQLALIGVGLIVFVSTNVDDILLLSAFFADRRMRARSVVIGQFLGIGTLVAVSGVAALLALAVPEAWVALLGIVPLLLGVRKFVELFRPRSTSNDGKIDPGTTRSRGSQALAVASVTIANGGDNLGIYIPLFAHKLSTIPLYIGIFAIMTALWCWLGHRLVNNRWIGKAVSRYAHLVLPFFLFSLGLEILWGARPLFHR